MKKSITVTPLATAALLAMAIPGHAQSQNMSDRQIDLYSEMWALAGVCSQLINYSVSQADLADRLNSDLANVDEDSFAQISTLRQSKLDQIRQNSQAVQGMPRGASRQRAVDEQAETLMTRCRRLADDALAQAYFHSQ